MELTHPIDEALRARLKAARVHQESFARAIGRSKGWLNKYMHGVGNATIDDAVRIAALLIGVEGVQSTGPEQRLVKAFRPLGEQDQADVIAYAKHRERLARRGPSTESSEPTGRSLRATTRRGPGKPTAGGG